MYKNYAKDNKQITKKLECCSPRVARQKMFIYQKDKPLLIVGYGNPLLGDDGAGIEAIKELNRLKLPSNITLLDGGSKGIDLIFLMQEYEQIIIIDAVMTSEIENNNNRKEKLNNGIVEFGIDKLVLKDDSYISLHKLNINATIKLIKSLNMKIPSLLFLGIMPVNINYGISLTDKVKRDISLTINRIKEIIEVK